MSQETMPDQLWSRRSLLLGERQEPRREITTDITVEGNCVRAPKRVENRKQQQRIFWGLSECFRLFDQQTCPLCSCLSFGCRISFDMDEWVYERDLKLYLRLAQRGSK